MKTTMPTCPTSASPKTWTAPRTTDQRSVPLVTSRRTRSGVPPALNEVLQTATAKDPAHRYPGVLRFSAALRAALPVVQRGPAQPLIEPLTERELDVLRLMIAGQSNTEIAQVLYLSA